MTDEDKAPKAKARPARNGIAFDDQDRDHAIKPKVQRTGSSEQLLRTEQSLPREKGVDAAGKRSSPSIEPGDLPETVRKRYYSGKARWSGDPAYFTSAEMKDPAFRDQGRRLMTATESLEVVKDLVAIAQHRGWEKIHVTGTESFRRSAWREAAQKGLEVRGYKPNERDLQELDRLRGDASRNTIAPVTGAGPSQRLPLAHDKTTSTAGAARQPVPSQDSAGSTLRDRAVASQLRIMEAVLRRTLAGDLDAVARVMTAARHQIDAHLAAGRTVRPAVVRDKTAMRSHEARTRAAEERNAQPREARVHKPSERLRAR